jgi:hypothetical protein
VKRACNDCRQQKVCCRMAQSSHSQSTSFSPQTPRLSMSAS